MRTELDGKYEAVVETGHRLDRARAENNSQTILLCILRLLLFQFHSSSLSC